MAKRQKRLCSFLNNEDLPAMNYSSRLVITEDRLLCLLFSFFIRFCFVYHVIKTAPKLGEPCFPQPFLSSHYLASEARISLVFSSTPTNEA